MVRKDDGNVLKKALMLEVNGQRNGGRLKQMQIWRRQVEENANKIGLEVDEAANRTRCEEGESDRYGNEVHPATLDLDQPHWSETG